MSSQERHMVTGAFGYSGKYIAARLLQEGYDVHTLTNSVHRSNPFAGTVKAHSFHFDNPTALAETLRGTTVLYNTYWVRFNHHNFNHAAAVENTLTLFDAARKAGVERIVHVSITNPSEDSPLEYFRGKARLEKALIETGLSFAILRPTVIFGNEDILINNIAWVLRRFPIFGVFGDGRYRVQPIYVDDLAKLAVAQGRERTNTIIDAIGPETFSYRELVRVIGIIIGCNRPFVFISPYAGYLISMMIGRAVGDFIITREEIAGLMQDRLATDSPPAGDTRFTDWAKEHAQSLGRHYASELARRHNRQASYEQV